jgi:ParB-like chromosome segregation protein Spo0J
MPLTRNDLTPELAIVEVGLDDLKQPKRHVRQLSRAAIADVENSIRQFGMIKPILFDEKNRVIDGVAVVEAMRNLGLTHAPCIQISHLSEAEA